MTARPATAKPRRPYLFIALGLTAVLYLPSLGWSFGHDQNVFAEMGSLILRGKLPYLDAWDIKPPNIFYVYALAEWLFGQTELAIRLVDFLTVVATSGILFTLVRNHASDNATSANRTALLATFLFVCIQLTLGLADTAQTESFALPFILGAMLLSYRSGSLVRTLIAGSLIGVAGFFKTTNFVFLFPLLIETLVRKDRRFTFASMLIAGVIVATGAELLFMASQGYLGEYLRITRLVLLEHGSEMAGTPVTISSVLRIMWVYLGGWILLTAWSLFEVSHRGRRTTFEARYLPSLRFMVFSAGVLIAGAIAVIAQRKGWGYHYVVLIAGLVPLVATACYPTLARASHRLAGRGVPFGAKTIGIASVILLTLVSTTGSHLLHAYYDSYLSITDHAKYMARLGAEQSMYYPLCTEQLAEYLREHSNPNDNVFILGQEPGAYWKSHRLPASRYFYTLLFTSPVMSSENFAELTADLTIRKPTLIIVERFDTLAFSGIPTTSEGSLKTPALAALDTLLHERYRFSDVVCNKFLVYERERYALRPEQP